MPQLYRTPGHATASEIDFDAPGKHVGYLRLPHSVHRSAYGWLPMPAASIRNGEGPVAVVMAGNHGDEYEGQVIVSRLIREVVPDMVSGQLILLPMANFPAAQAGSRTSPIDGGNLNRLFPGNPAGSFTESLAHYIEHAIISRSDVVVDLHSGGSSLVYGGGAVFAAAPRDPEERARVLPLLYALGMDYACLREAINQATSIGAARRQGSVSFVAEIGGAGQVTPRLLRQAWQGVCNLLGQLGVLSGPLLPSGPAVATQLLDLDFGSDLCHIYARSHGIFEPLVELGDTVQAGEPVARLHDPANPWLEPVEVKSEGTGRVICKRAIARCEPGDCLYQLASEQ